MKEILEAIFREGEKIRFKIKDNETWDCKNSRKGKNETT